MGGWGWGTCEIARWFGGWTAIAGRRIDGGGDVFKAADTPDSQTPGPSLATVRKRRQRARVIALEETATSSYLHIYLLFCPFHLSHPHAIILFTSRGALCALCVYLVIIYYEPALYAPNNTILLGNEIKLP